MAHQFNNMNQEVTTRQNFRIQDKQGTAQKQTTTHSKHLSESIGIVTLLGAWILLSLANNGLFLKEALLCSAIICFLLFFHAADRDGLSTDGK